VSDLVRSIIKTVFIFFRLKRFDESTVVSRKGSQAPTPPLSVKGIGNKGSLTPQITLYLFLNIFVF
jgi:hypothetical protein